MNQQRRCNLLLNQLISMFIRRQTENQRHESNHTRILIVCQWQIENLQRKLKYFKIRDSKSIELKNNDKLSTKYNKTSICLTRIWEWWQIDIWKITYKVAIARCWQPKGSLIYDIHKVGEGRWRKFREFFRWL